MYAIYETWHRRKGQRTCHTLNVGEVRRGREQLRDEENSRTNLPWPDRRLLEKASSRMRSTLNVEQDHLPPRERERESCFARLTARAFHPEMLGDRAEEKSKRKGRGFPAIVPPRPLSSMRGYGISRVRRASFVPSTKSLFTSRTRENDTRKWLLSFRRTIKRRNDGEDGEDGEKRASFAILA